MFFPFRCLSSELAYLKLKFLFVFLLERERLKQSSFWTLNGIMIPYEESNNRKPSRTSTSVTHCMTKLVESQKRRILVFKNGESFGGVEVVANRFEEVGHFLKMLVCFLDFYTNNIQDRVSNLSNLKQILIAPRTARMCSKGRGSASRSAKFGRISFKFSSRFWMNF